jgi:predicted ribonuclease toxin of YeeF-YezG toxin-antitoxin module
LIPAEVTAAGLWAIARQIIGNAAKLKRLGELCANIVRNIKNRLVGNEPGGQEPKPPGENEPTDPNGGFPLNDGFAGTPVATELKPGIKFDRYGDEDGTFAAPAGTPFSQRSLRPGDDLKPLNEYEVVKPFNAKTGKTAPWFGESGGGTQYKFDRSIRDLIDQGFIRKVNK